MRFGARAAIARLAGARSSAQAPFILLRGRACLRMEYRPANLPTLQHAALVFTSAREPALRAPVDVAPE